MSEQTAESIHRDQSVKRLTPLGRKLFKYIEFDKDETLLAEIRKHPIGIIAIITVGAFISLSVLIACALLANNLEGLGLSSGDGTFRALLIGVGVVVSLLAAVVTTISVVLYTLNVIYITDEKIAEVAYLSIFNRKVTQLNIGKVEDVTVSQKGILSHIFGYGTLLVETAGEIPNRAFSFVPNPNQHSHTIIEAHERYVEKYGN